ncbi:MAG: HEAT repeat domain-containing protein [Chitinophagaceae bacterium]
MAKTTTKKVETISSTQEDTIIAIVQNKATKVKEKVVLLSGLLLDKKITIDELVEKAKSQNDVIKATLIEAMEYASKTNPEIINDKAFVFAVQSLKEDAPRVKWEAARVISNTAHLFPRQLSKAVVNLLDNTEHSGTVVRWSAATALSKIILLSTLLNKELIPTAEAIIQREEDNGVKKIYQQVLKKSKK